MFSRNSFCRRISLSIQIQLQIIIEIMDIEGLGLCLWLFNLKTRFPLHLQFFRSLIIFTPFSVNNPSYVFTNWLISLRSNVSMVNHKSWKGWRRSDGWDWLNGAGDEAILGADHEVWSSWSVRVIGLYIDQIWLGKGVNSSTELGSGTETIRTEGDINKIRIIATITTSVGN